MGWFLGNAEGADDFRFAGFDIVLRDADAVFLLEREDKFDELLHFNTRFHFAVQEVAGGHGKRGFVDGINGLMKWLDVEEGVFHLRGLVLEAFVNAAAGAGGFAKLAAGGGVFLLNPRDGLLHERVMRAETRERGCGGFAGGGAEDFMLALGDGASLFVHPSERVVAVGGADIDHNAGNGLRATSPDGLRQHGERALVEKTTLAMSGMVFLSVASISQAFFQIW